MKSEKLISRCVLLAVLLLAFTACAGTKIKQSVLMPANSNEMKNVKKLTVVGFSGDQNNQFSNVTKRSNGNSGRIVIR